MEHRVYHEQSKARSMPTRSRTKSTAALQTSRSRQGACHATTVVHRARGDRATVSRRWDSGRRATDERHRGDTEEEGMLR